MTLTLEGVLDLTLLLGWVFARGAVWLAVAIATAFAGALGSIPVLGPIVKQAIENSIITPLDQVARGLDAGFAFAFGVINAGLHDWVGLNLYILGKLNHGIRYLVTTVIQAIVKTFTHPIWTEIGNVNARATELATVVASDFSAAETYAKHEATHALNTAEAYAKTEATKLHNIAEADIAKVKQYTTSAVATAESYVGVAGQSTVGELQNIYGNLDLSKFGYLLGAIPVVGAIVGTVVKEAGLTDKACRQKVGQVCSTDQQVWSDLLGLLAAAGLAFNFEELVKVAEGIADECLAVIKTAA